MLFWKGFLALTILMGIVVEATLFKIFQRVVRYFFVLGIIINDFN